MAPGKTGAIFLRSKSFWLALIVLALSLLPFVPGLHGPFLLDDHANLQRARAITGSLSEWLDIAIRNDSGLLKRPISNLSFAGERWFLGDQVFHFKLTNLLIHYLVALAIWRLALQIIPALYPGIRGTSQARNAALAAAAVWAAHPIQVSTVLYVVQRMTQISALFVVLSLTWTIAWFHQNPPARPRSPINAALIAWSLVALGVLGKENAILFPAFLLALYAASEQFRALIQKTPERRLMLAMCVWAPILSAAIAMPWAYRWALNGYAVRDFSIWDRLLTEPFALAHYLGTILVPNIRYMGIYLDDIPVRHASDLSSWLGIAAVVIFVVSAWKVRGRAPAITFAAFWFLAGHLLESTFLPLEIAFEHRNYLPLFGPALAAGYYLSKLPVSRWFVYLRSAIFLVPAMLAITTTVRSAQWSEPERFIVHEVENHPDSPRAQTDAAAFDSARGDVHSALRRIKIAQTLRPDSFWYKVMDIQIACDVPGHSIDWEGAINALELNPAQIGADEALMQIAGRFLRHNCNHVSPSAVEKLLHSSLFVVAKAKLPEREERFMVLISWLRDAQGDPADAKAWLHRAAIVNPKGALALQRIAYDALNAGDIPEAQTAINEIRRRSKKYGNVDSFVLRELEFNLQLAQSSESASG